MSIQKLYKEFRIQKELSFLFLVGNESIKNIISSSISIGTLVVSRTFMIAQDEEYTELLMDF